MNNRDNVYEEFKGKVIGGEPAGRCRSADGRKIPISG